VIAGLCGYLAFGYGLSGSILISLQRFIDERDVFVIVAVIGCVVSVCIAHALHVYPIRQTGEYIARKLISEDLKENRLLAAGIGAFVVYLSLLVAIYFPSFIKVIHIVGALASSCIAYIFPPIFKIKIHGKLISRALWLEYITLSVGLVAGSLGTFVAISTISICCVNKPLVL
jgi:amino acid permease